MKKLIAFVSAFLLLPFSALAAVTITPLAGVSGQSTAQATFFATPLAVRVTDANGPVAGVQVNFVNTDGNVFFATGTVVSTAGFIFSGHEAAFTDASGVAVAYGLIGFVPGSTTLTISTVGNNAGSVTIPLTVVPGGPTRIEAVSGSGQRAAVGTMYAMPWIAQAFDANGNVVPNAAILFAAPADPTLPSVMFDGGSSIWVRADASGLAVSPLPRANNVNGHGEGTAMAVSAGTAVRSAFFDYFNENAGGSGGGTGDGCGRQGKGNGNCGNSPAHSGGQGNNGNGKG